MPGRSLTCDDELDLRADDVPDLIPNLSATTAKYRGVFLRSEREPVRIVVEADQLATPEDEHRVIRRQEYAQRGTQRLRPVCAAPQERSRTNHERV